MILIILVIYKVDSTSLFLSIRQSKSKSLINLFGNSQVNR